MNWDGTYESKILRPKTSSSSKPMPRNLLSSQLSLSHNLLYGKPLLYVIPGDLIKHPRMCLRYYDGGYRFISEVYGDFSVVPDGAVYATTHKFERAQLNAPVETIKFKAELEEIRRKGKAGLLSRAIITRDELRSELNSPAILGPTKKLRDRLDFWNYPDWDKAGNLRQGGQPFWMFDNAEPKPEPIPEPPKPTHKAVKKRVGSTYITVMEKII